MSKNATLSCRCREVRGLVTSVSPYTVNRVVCYCDDCQAFLHHLGRAELLDAQGGTDIIQIAPASLSFGQGEERIVGLRLAPRACIDGTQAAVGRRLAIRSVRRSRS